MLSNCLRSISNGRLFCSASSLVNPANSGVKYTGRKLLDRIRTVNFEEFQPKAWVEDMSKTASETRPLGFVDLHPDVFAVHPNLHLVHKNLRWQAHYRVVDWRCITTRAELLYRSQKKPRPQKGTGMARHGTRRNHLWIGGGQLKGPRGPRSFFSILPWNVRLQGLLTMLTIKHTQNDLRIVENLKLSEELEKRAKKFFYQQTSTEVSDPEQIYNIEKEFDDTSTDAANYLRQYVDDQDWGPSVLFITDEPSISIDLLYGDNPLQLTEETFPQDLAIRMACESYARYIESTESPEASAFEVNPIRRAAHPARGLTIMSLSGLNVWSMVHHDTLVISLSALEKLEQKLIRAQKLVYRDSSSKDAAGIPREPDWMIGKDWSKDDVSPLEIEHERHFTGSVGELEDLKRRLS